MRRVYSHRSTDWPDETVGSSRPNGYGVPLIFSLNWTRGRPNGLGDSPHRVGPDIVHTGLFVDPFQLRDWISFRVHLSHRTSEPPLRHPCTRHLFRMRVVVVAANIEQ